MANPTGELKQVAVDSLQPNPRNYRSHPADQVERIAKSLEQHGQFKNVVVQASTNRIIAGHGVWQAAKQRGDETILAMVLDVSDAEAAQILVDDNELSRRAEDDGEALVELLAELRGTENEPLSFNSNAEVEDLLRELTYPRMEPPEEFPEYDESIADGVKTATCPECGHEFPV